MQRIPETEVMDKMAESIAYDQMDFREVNQAFVDRAIVLNIKDKILDVGTGTARIPILLARELLARKNTNFHITAIDLAQSMLELGKQHLITAELEDYISLQLVDAKQMPYPDRRFDCIISNSIVHHVSAVERFFDEIGRLLKPNGGLLIRDLLRPKDEAEVDYFVSTYAGTGDPEQQKLFRDSLHAAYTLDEIKALFQGAGLTGVHIYQSSDRHWTAERRYLG
jgi:ubiquinone/menaquinone biosynthesis C-methylase UbiE